MDEQKEINKKDFSQNRMKSKGKLLGWIGMASLLLVGHSAHAIRNGIATNEFPAVGFLEPGCTATLINPNTAITVNHCLVQAGKLKNALFHYTRSDGSTDTLIPLKAEVMSEVLPMEIALVRFQNQASGVTFAQLPDEPIGPEQIEAFAVGYGLNPALTVRTSQRQLGVVAIKGYENIMDQGLMIQTMPFDSRSQLACHGDSGGPLLIGPKLVGVASFNASDDSQWPYYDPFKKCRTALAGYYVPIHPYLGWIRATLQKLGQK